MIFIPALSPRFDLDHLVFPYAERLFGRILVSTAEYRSGFRVDSSQLWLDSGGFAAFNPSSRVRESAGLGHLICADGTSITPQRVHDLAHTLGAQVEFTLDFPTRDDSKRDAYQQLSLRNALWTLTQPRRRLVYAAVQPGQDITPILRANPDGIGLGGLVPWARDHTSLHQEVRRVREQLPDSLPLHVFGIGHPDALRVIRDAGATSADSSSAQRTAVSGRTWHGTAIPGPSVPERLHTAIQNLKEIHAALV